MCSMVKEEMGSLLVLDVDFLLSGLEWDGLFVLQIRNHFSRLSKAIWVVNDRLGAEITTKVSYSIPIEPSFSLAFAGKWEVVDVDVEQGGGEDRTCRVSAVIDFRLHLEPSILTLKCRLWR